MIDERAYELLCCQLGLANEEKAGLRKQNKELIARLESIEESNKENTKALVDTINDLKESLEKQSTTVEHYRKEMELMRKQLEAKDEVNRMLANEISNLRIQLEDSRKHRFGRTSEQRRLLNNRNIDGLSPTDTYYARAYVIQKGTTIYGNTISFSTSQQTTTLSTSAVTQIGASTATFNASILDAGTPAYTERGFCYSKSSTPTIADHRRQVSGSGAGDFSLQVSNLEYPITYYVRAYAIQAGKTIYGNIVSFTTQQNGTSISTSAVTQIGTTTATFNASISDTGLPAYTERGFCYSTNGNPTIATNRKPVSGTGIGAFSLQVTGLEYPITYYVCAYAIQDGNVIYGNTVSFETIFREVAVSTSAATSVSENSAKLNGTINDVGTPAYTQRGFCYSSTNSSPTIANDKVIQYSSQSGNYTANISNLQEGTTYYVRTFAVQDNKYVYGNTVSFTTNALPVVRTGPVTSLTKTGTYFYQWNATFNGTVVSAGSPAYTERGFVYGTSYDPTVGSGTKVSSSGRGTGNFSANVSNLSDMKTYYLRAYVKAGSKYYYGESVSISTF